MCCGCPGSLESRGRLLPPAIVVTKETSKKKRRYCSSPKGTLPFSPGQRFLRRSVGFGQNGLYQRSSTGSRRIGKRLATKQPSCQSRAASALGLSATELSYLPTIIVPQKTTALPALPSLCSRIGVVSTVSRDDSAHDGLDLVQLKWMNCDKSMSRVLHAHTHFSLNGHICPLTPQRKQVGEKMSKK